MSRHPEDEGFVISKRSGLVVFEIHLQPRASRCEIVGLHDGGLRIRLTSPPVENRANRQLVEFLADLLKLPKSAVHLLSGDRSRRKTVGIEGLGLDEVKTCLSPYLVR